MKIVFVSKLMPKQMKASSTDITTDNLIKGLYQNNLEIVLVLFTDCKSDEYIEYINSNYSSIAKKIIILETKYQKKSKTKYATLISNFENYFFNKHTYKKEIDDLSTFVDDNSILLSHTPNLCSIFFCREFKKKFINIKYIQYWSDPITLTGINPEKYSFKRFPYKWLEGKCLSLADEIVYGPKTLYFFQKKFFPKLQIKMRGVDLFYTIKETDNKIDISNDNSFLYAGNYYKYTRNIEPLFQAFQEIDNDYNLIVYGSGDVQLPEGNNIKIMDRISPKQLEIIENTYLNIICLMNSSGIQIPGKIFYNMEQPHNILVIADGKYRGEIIEYLQSYNRFIIVDNNVNSIIEGLNTINSLQFDIEKIKEDYSPKKIANDIIK